jgi:transketolase
MLFAQVKPYGYTSNSPPIKFKFFKYMALTKTDLQKIGDLMDSKFKERFAEQDTKWEMKLDERFAEQDRKWDKKLDKKFKERFAEQDRKWDKKLDKKFKERFAEQDAKWEAKLDKRFKQNNSELITKLYEVFATKQDLEDCKNELRDEFRDKISSLQESILRFYNEWRLGQPVMVKNRLDNHEERIQALEENGPEYDKD